MPVILSEAFAEGIAKHRIFFNAIENSIIPSPNEKETEAEQFFRSAQAERTARNTTMMENVAI